MPRFSIIAFASSVGERDEIMIARTFLSLSLSHTPIGRMKLQTNQKIVLLLLLLLTRQPSYRSSIQWSYTSQAHTCTSKCNGDLDAACARCIQAWHKNQ